MTDGAMTTLMVLFGVGVVVYLLVRQQTVPGTDPTKPQSPPSVLGGGDIYSKGANLIYNALTNPNAIQHAVGLPGSDGWGQGIFVNDDYDSLPPDVKLYVRMSEAAKFAQNLQSTPENVRRISYSAAIAIMPALREGTCCDFDPNVPLAKGGGHMGYVGDYQVTFNQNGRQRRGTMLKLDPPAKGEGLDVWMHRLGIPLYMGNIPYNT